MVVHFKVWLVIIVEEEGCVEVQAHGFEVGPKEVVLAGLKWVRMGLGYRVAHAGGGELSLLEWVLLGVNVCGKVGWF